MRTSTLIFLALIFFLLVGGYLFTQRAKEPGVESIFTTLGQKKWLKADRIKVFFDGEKGFSLVREPETWLIEDDFPKPASKVLIQEFLRQLADLSGEKRAEGDKFFPRFKVGDKEALHIVLYQGKQELAHILVGKRGPQWNSSFIRLKGQKEIYLVPVNLLSKFEIWSVEPGFPKAKDFLDLEVLEVPLAKLKTLSFRGQKVSWTLLRKEDHKPQTFVLKIGTKEKRLSSEEAEKFLRRLFPLYAEKVIKPEEFKGKRATLTFVSRLGREVEVDFGACQKEKDQEICLVKRPPFVYRINRSLIEAFFKPSFP